MGPPFVLIEGEGSHQGKVGFTPLYPGVNPTPHWLPVPHWGELKFPRVINPDSPLNDSRQLDCSNPQPPTPPYPIPAPPPPPSRRLLHMEELQICQLPLLASRGTGGPHTSIDRHNMYPYDNNCIPRTVMKISSFKLFQFLHSAS